MKNRKINGMISNTFLIVTTPLRNRLLVKNQPVITRNTTSTIYATGELKYDLSSFLNIVNIFFINFLRFFFRMGSC